MQIVYIKETIKTFEKLLKRYQADLETHPGSFFYSGLVKNTEEHIAELKKELKLCQTQKKKS
jgi:menaquinone-dependent protoporphyrinogen IX oxidase